MNYTTLSFKIDKNEANKIKAEATKTGTKKMQSRTRIDQI